MEQFLKGNVGQYLLGCIEAEIADAHAQLASVSPWRRRRIQQLQNEIWRAQSVKGWLVDAIQAGRTAEAALVEQAAEDY